MGLPEIFAKWHESNDMDSFFRAYRMSISLNDNPEQKTKHMVLYKKIVELYYDMKQHPSDKDKINQELEVLFLEAETYIQEVVNCIEAEFTTYKDDFKVPDFEPHKKEKKENE